MAQAMVPALAPPGGGIIPPNTPNVGLITVNRRVYEVYIYTYTAAGARQYQNLKIDPLQIANIQTLADRVLNTLTPAELQLLQIIDDEGVAIQGRPVNPNLPAPWQPFAATVIQHAQPAQAAAAAPGGGGGAPVVGGGAAGLPPPASIPFNNLAALTTPCRQDVTAPELSMLFANPVAANPLTDLGRAAAVHFPPPNSITEKRALVALEKQYAPPVGTNTYYDHLQRQYPTPAACKQAIANIPAPRNARLSAPLRQSIDQLYEAHHANQLITPANLHTDLISILRGDLGYGQHLSDYYNFVARAKGLATECSRLLPTKYATPANYPLFDEAGFKRHWHKRSHNDGIAGVTQAAQDAIRVYQLEVHCLIEALALFADHDGLPLDPNKHDQKSRSMKRRVAGAVASTALTGLKWVGRKIGVI